METIKDYLHLYLPFEFFFFGYKYKVIGFENGGHFFKFWHEHGFFDVLKSDFKLPLRQLSDMTEEEMNECGNLIYDFSDDKYLNKWSYRDFETLLASEQFLWLLSKHFDLFGLIEKGLAIDATTLKEIKQQ